MKNGLADNYRLIFSYTGYIPMELIAIAHRHDPIRLRRRQNEQKIHTAFVDLFSGFTHFGSLYSWYAGGAYD
jgi:hypothetical protein